MAFLDCRHGAWAAIGSVTLLLAARCPATAGNGSHPIATSDETREAYVGNFFSRLPSHAFLRWLVPAADTSERYAVSHVDDRGVEMIWLETAQLPPTPKERPVFTVVDVVVLPSDYRVDGLVVTPCGRLSRSSPVVALTDPKTRIARHAWAIDAAASRFIEYSPAADSCTSYAPGDD